MHTMMYTFVTNAMYNYSSSGLTSGTFWLMIALMAWDSVWKAIGMYKSARNSHLVWFICIFIFNTAGVLPIIYLLGFQNKSRNSKKKSSR